MTKENEQSNERSFGSTIIVDKGHIRATKSFIGDAHIELEDHEGKFVRMVTVRYDHRFNDNASQRALTEKIVHIMTTGEVPEKPLAFSPRASLDMATLLTDVGIEDHDWVNLIAFSKLPHLTKDYGISKQELRRLAHLGLLRWIGGSRFHLTAFGEKALIQYNLIHGQQNQ